MTIKSYSLTKQGELFGSSFESFYPCLVDMTGVSAFPYDYALYASTDHDAGAGGIWLYVCNGDPTVKANWSDYDTELAAGGFDSIVSKPASNPIYTDSTEGDQTETPYVNVISGTVYMTYHQEGTPSSGEQRTMLATSTDGVNFTRYTAHTGGSSAVILTPVGANGNHTGYFRWGANPFSGVAYTYIGKSLMTGGGNPFKAVWGSNDAINWDLIQVLYDDTYALNLPSGFELNPQTWDPASIIDLGGGEYLALGSASTSGSGGASKSIEVFEYILDANGREVKRTAKAVIERGAASSIDENEVLTPTTLSYNGTILCVYHASQTTSTVNRLAYATGSIIDAPVMPKRLPGSDNWDTEVTQDFKNASSFSSGLAELTAGTGSTSFDATGLRCSNPSTSGDKSGVKADSSFVPNDYDFIEIYAENFSHDSTINIARLGFGDTPGSESNGVFVIELNSSSNIWRARTRVSGSNVDDEDTAIQYGEADTQSVGVRWWPRENKAQMLGNDRTVIWEWTVDGTISKSASYTPYALLQNQDGTIEQVTIRYQLDDSVAPTITAAEITGDVLTITSDKPIDFGSGGEDDFALTASGGAAALTYNSGYGTTTQTFDISRSISPGETVTLAYTQPTDGWVDENNNELATFSGQSVTVNGTFNVAYARSTKVLQC